MTEPGSALGPDWHEDITLRGAQEEVHVCVCARVSACMRVTVCVICTSVLCPGVSQSDHGVPVRG